MRVYNHRQLMVISSLICALFCWAFVRLLPAERGVEPPSFERPGFVYEVRGAVAEPGFYGFKERRTLAQLLQAGGGQPVENGGTRPIPNGSRVTVGPLLRIEPMGARERLAFFLPLTFNSASAEDLERIPGIGKKTASRLLAFRETRNRIRDLRELLQVKGIGEKRLQALAPYLSIE